MLLTGQRIWLHTSDVTYTLQEFRQRGGALNSGSGAPSTSGRSDPADYGVGLEDSWDLSDDQYTPFPTPAPADVVPASQWQAGTGLTMSGASELWSRVGTVSRPYLPLECFKVDITSEQSRVLVGKGCKTFKHSRQYKH